jgi:hypothetical protein
MEVNAKYKRNPMRPSLLNIKSAKIIAIADIAALT